MYGLTLRKFCLIFAALSFSLAFTVNARAGDELVAAKPSIVAAQDNLQEKVQDIVDEQCAFAGCHTGANAPQNLDLSEEMLLANLVGVKSAEGPWLRVKPGDPANSYLMRKLRGAPGIKGERMPRGAKPLAPAEIAVIEAWIKSLPAGMKPEEPKLTYATAFPGWTLANLQTAETLEKGAFLYRITHKFNAPVRAGFDQLFGLDGGSSMLTQLAFPLSNALSVTVERSKVNATFEIGAKWRLLREKTDGSMPISAALYTGVDWATIKGLPDPANTSQTLSRTAGERFAFFAQLPVSKQIAKRVSFLVTPGILLNGNVRLDGEDPLVTLGVGGRIAMSQKYAFFAEIVPVLSGDQTAATIGSPPIKNGQITFFDTFAAGLEIKIGGHIFHLFVSNSAGNTTNQYMSGGDFDVADDLGNLRLGFNIYRILNYPF
ncbi:DUF5777 family beta-barrel protein [candidate division KSB1 bacterium]|nr:DUF5777 family beta-barrel protein [candidate division KSB1 bacterium]